LAIAQRSTQGAKSLRKAFEKAVRSLAKDALAHGLAPESNDHPVEIRQILFRTRYGHNYRALYTIKDQEVNVLRVRGPGQDLILPEDLRMP
jgi:Txe/YoeB family toxin of Txe-Axe toxin-antitoxin module